MAANGNLQSQQAVTVSLKELIDGAVSFQTLEEAFGPSSLGIIIVRGLPTEFSSLRHNLLSYASYLANLPVEELAKLERPDAKWLVGWSCGKETLANGRFDTLKGSYYVNCRREEMAMYANVEEELAKRYPGFPEYTASNIWPSEDILPGFEPAFRKLCSLIISVARLVARACDQYAEAKIDGYQKGYLEHVVTTSHVSKARLLHYFPMTEQQNDANGDTSMDEDDWCGTHLDHDCLTGLTSAMYVDEAAHPPKLNGTFEPLAELDSPPDRRAGLYIRSRSGDTVKVSIPRDCLAFQTGEALEIITKGKFKAVPHFVRGAAPGKGGAVARNTLAVFTQPNLWEKVDEKRDFAAFAKEVVESNH
jgi:isopenicillin N synthase-like dioxygenase